MGDPPDWPQGEEPLRLSVADNNNNNKNNHHHRDTHDNEHGYHDNHDTDYLSASSLRNNDSLLQSTATTVITMDPTRASGGGGDAPEERQTEQAGAGTTTTTAAAIEGLGGNATGGEREERGQQDGQQEHDESNASLPPPLPDNEDSSLALYSSEDDNHERGANQTLMEEREMQHKLLDMESSFLPEQPSTVDIERTGADDTFLMGVVPNANAQEQTEPSRPHAQSEDYTQLSLPMQEDGTGQDGASAIDNEHAPQTPRQDATRGQNMGSTTPIDEYHQGDHHLQAQQQEDGRQKQEQQQQQDDTNMFDNVESSSPAADAASRNANRSGHTDEIMGDRTNESSQVGIREDIADDSRILGSMNQSEGTDSHTTQGGKSGFFSSGGSGTGEAEILPRRRGSRPKYLNSRQSAQRLSNTSTATNTTTATTSTTDATDSDATLGLDYALQGNKNQNTEGRSASMARSVSLGSVASGISGYSDENASEKRNVSGATDGGLHTLEEEDDLFLPSNAGSPPPVGQSGGAGASDVDGADPNGPATPKPSSRQVMGNLLPTDTAIAERIKDVQVPSTFARQFRDDLAQHGLSPDKRGATPAFGKSGRSLTLKEQSSTIDRLSKENFDLKVRIHFLNESLNKRSEEGIKEMISENVELKSDKLKLQKDNQGLKKKLRNLEKELKDKDQQSDRESMFNHDPDASDEENQRDPVQNEEMEYLRERVEIYEQEVERLRSEGLAKETEKRRLAEMVNSLNDGRQVGSEVGSREERDMWKDMLDVEIAAREHSERENRKLREETERLRYRIETGGSGNGKPEFRDSFSFGPFDRKTSLGASQRTVSNNNVETDLLKQENAELRKEVSAQASMLTSRNREKERLYEEIEGLKLANGGRSVAGDSILDRSASRAQRRSPSEGTESRVDDEASREELELRNGQLRDKVSSLKLENHAIREQMEEYARDLQALDNEYQADIDVAEAELNFVRKQRDQAVQMADERDMAFQDLRAEAQEEVDKLLAELDQRIEESRNLNEELRQQEASLHLLQAEVRAAGEGILRLEEDSQNNLERYQSVQQELADATHEIQALERSLREANNKVQQLMVQSESSQNEISFLREEQDSDKIKIGDLESELKTYEINLGTEKDRTRDLEEKLMYATTHHQALFGNFQKDSERTRNDLNRQALAAKEDARNLKRALTGQEVETNTWRERLVDLENNLREALGDLSGSRSSLINNIVKLQKELESTALELESTRAKLDEKESSLRNRDSLMESHGLESRKLSELLERERHGRRADKQSFEQALKSQHQASRTITQSSSRITELETAYKQDRKRFAGLEQQFKDQLSERNAMLLTIWRRLSTMCGPDWAHSNSLINGNLPSQEVIGNILFWPGFSRNLMLAVKTLEAVIGGFKNRIKGVERDLMKQYQNVEHVFNQRVKRLDRMEDSVMNMRAQSQAGASPELSKLRGENRLLKAELNIIQSSPSRRSVAAGTRAGAAASGSPTATSSRHVDMDERRSGPSQFSSATTLADQAGSAGGAGGAMVHSRRSRNMDSGNEKWIQRLRELEKGLKAEREARLLDRGGARKRLEERDAENQRLRAQLERQEGRSITAVPTDFGQQSPSAKGQGRVEGPSRAQGQGQGHQDESSEDVGFSVDIEY